MQNSLSQQGHVLVTRGQRRGGFHAASLTAVWLLEAFGGA
jgi:hypothetical protein